MYRKISIISRFLKTNFITNRKRAVPSKIFHGYKGYRITLRDCMRCGVFVHARPEVIVYFKRRFLGYLDISTTLTLTLTID